MKPKFWNWFGTVGLLAVLALAMAACQAGEPERVEVEVTREVPVETIVEVPAEPSEMEEEMMEPEPTTRKGGWLDVAVFVEEPNAEAAITRLEAGELDIYAYAVAESEIFETVQGLDDLTYNFSYGSLNELTFNVAPIEGDLNPFSNQKIREAMNWLVDRNYIVNEIYGGLGNPKYTALTTVFPDFAKVAPTMAQITSQYAYNPDQAVEVITAEMESMGAEMVDGKWTFNGEPVDIIFLIRVEDLRRDIGDYVSNLLDEIGFTVDRQYKTSAEASVYWIQGDPFEGDWHMYTGGWISNFVNRDQGVNFQDYYTPQGFGVPLWQAYVNAPDFADVADRLARNDFTSLEERSDLISQAALMSVGESQRIFLNDRASFTPFKSNVEAAGDLAAGVSGARILPWALRFTDQEGGGMTVAMPSILDDPWNPVDGSNWLYDAAVQRMTGDWGMMTDPFTGLRWPHRIERAEVFVESGLPVGRSDVSEDWLTLEFVDEIAVPEDAWSDWDAENQVFLTAADRFPEGTTAKQRTVIYYPEDLFETTWHDGSPFSVADIVTFIIMNFDWGNEASPIFDAAQAASLQSFMASFKGVRILSEDPLVIETYTDAFALEAELIDQISTATWYPQYGRGIGAWHTIGLGYLADSQGELAFSSAKADELEVEWMSYIGGPSLAILEADMDQAAADGYIPYAATLGDFISADEVAQRWSNLQEWFRRRGHFWVGTGPYYLEGAFPVEGSVIARHYPNHIDFADRWAGFSEPKIAEAVVDGPATVDIGSEATYDVSVTFAGESYPLSELEGASYLVFDATGALVGMGDAEAVEDGLFQVTLGSDITSGLEAGANRLDVVVVSKVVAIPTTASFEFVTQ